MNYKQLCDLFETVESRFDVLALTHRGVHVWPIVRFLLTSGLHGDGPRRLHSGDRTYQATTQVVERWMEQNGRPLHEAVPALLADYETQLGRWYEAMRRDQPLGGLILTRGVQYGQTFPDGTYSPILDPFHEHLSAVSSSLKVQATPEDRPQMHPTVHLPLAMGVLREKLKTLLTEGTLRSRVDADVPGLDDLKALLKELLPEVEFIEPVFSGMMENVAETRPFFRGLLRVLRPQVIFESCYYDGHTMALNSVAAEFGIPTVDVQHGQQGDLHPLYTHQHRCPPGGYALLPRYFWQWGEHFTHHFRFCAPEFLAHHRPVVGGHPSLSRWRGGLSPRLEADQQRFLDALDATGADRAPRILVALQPGQSDQPVSPDLLAIMKAAPSHWKWLVRRHPVSSETIDDIAAFLIGHGMADRCEVAFASMLPLPALLRRVDVHVTRSSSTVHEALSFGVPSIVTDAAESAVFALIVERGGATVATTTEDGVAAIARYLREGTTAAPTIEADPDLMVRALDTVRLSAPPTSPPAPG